MKQCCTCKKEKELIEFSYKKKDIGLKQSYCKECAKRHRKKQYENNKDYYIQHAKRNNKRYYEENRKKLCEYLSLHPCIDCGEDDFIVLEFDHIKGNKLCNVSNLMGGSWSKVLEEINKCVVRCSNCHKRKTAKQFGWYKYLNAPVSEQFPKL